MDHGRGGDILVVHGGLLLGHVSIVNKGLLLGGGASSWTMVGAGTSLTSMAASSLATSWTIRRSPVFGILSSKASLGTKNLRALASAKVFRRSTFNTIVMPCFTKFNGDGLGVVVSPMLVDYILSLVEVNQAIFAWSFNIYQ